MYHRWLFLLSCAGHHMLTHVQGHAGGVRVYPLATVDLAKLLPAVTLRGSIVIERTTDAVAARGQELAVGAGPADPPSVSATLDKGVTFAPTAVTTTASTRATACRSSRSPTKQAT
ncbi:hypothetical protein GCM10023191_022890 [Actinoallomurus oryzae]|uniref:Uncharacterized protein n=1 Tax=Actinoallomurus oryzae TaxID=502180 RepID=A0ABP8PS90_9ACTN